MFLWLFIVLMLLGCNLPTTRPSDLYTATPSFPITPISTVTPTNSVGGGGTIVFEEPTDAPTPTATLPGIGPNNFADVYNPLTGLLVDDLDILDRRPISVKINNYPRSNRPQWGLSLADIVYEYYHNNELTRFHAIYYGQQADQIGPIRSGRFFDDYLVMMYESIFVFAQADFRVMERFKEASYVDQLIYYLDGDCPPAPVCRVDRSNFNFLVTDTYAPGPFVAETGGDNRRQNLDGMWFYEQVPLNGTDAGRFYLRYSYGAYLYWDFDTVTGRYLRYQDAQDDFGGRGEAYELLTDRLNGAAVAADNVVVLMMPHFYAVYEPPKDGKPAVEVVDMEVFGRGQGIAFRDGLGYLVEWVWEDADSMLYLVTLEGDRFPLKPGVTWFQVVTDHSELEVLENVWKMVFHWK